jgi:peptidoglycan/xylan/chitin deacetylase (PgdA/CDA1 family)
MINRRSFIKTSLLTSVALQWHQLFLPGKTHILTFSFDDGFRKSFLKIADICEENGIKACLNVIASGHFPTFQAVDDWILPELMGDFEDWNQLQKRGHEIMPHSWQHLNLARQPVDKAKMLISKCLDYFAEHLNGYENKNAVFNFPFNASTPELEAFLLAKVRAVRTRGDGTFNAIPDTQDPMRLQCISMGPGNIDDWVENQVNTFLKSNGGWLILNTHGLDDEGWGPMRTTFFAQLLKKLVKINSLEIVPTGKVLKRSAG